MDEAAKFKSYTKIGRWSRPVVITEKLDGTNGLIYVNDTASDLRAGSRNRWLDPVNGNDNHGFGLWVILNKEELLGLGPGYHYGEWWGVGIGRKYGLREKKFSLFNPYGPKVGCTETVPILYEGVLVPGVVEETMAKLKESGSVAAPGFMEPEGVVIYHTANGALFKKTFEKDREGKEGA